MNGCNLDENTLKELGLSGNAPLMLDEEVARQVGYKCRDCGSRAVVYYISNPKPPWFHAGAYCFKCLFERCLKGRGIPYPMELELVERLQREGQARLNNLAKTHFGGMK